MVAKKKEPSEFQTFTNVMDHILSVPKEELARREEAYRKLAEANPRKRGPKRKPR